MQGRIVVVVVLLGLTVLNPLHLPWSLPWLTDQLAGTGLGRFLVEREGTIIVLGTVYFTAAMIPVYYWIWQRTSRRRALGRTTAPAAAVSPASETAQAEADDSEETADDSYRGPGGGKRPPRPSRSRRRRPRARR